jgi:hypothetical protein
MKRRWPANSRRGNCKHFFLYTGRCTAGRTAAGSASIDPVFPNYVFMFLDFKPHPYLVAREWIRIHCGALTCMVGALVRRKNNLRVVLTVNLITQSVSVEVGTDEIEPVRM